MDEEWQEDTTYWCRRCGSLKVINGQGLDYCGDCGSCDISCGSWEDFITFKDGGDDE